MIKHLPDEARKELDSAFRSSKSAKEQNRIQVIRLLAKGFIHKEVTDITSHTEGSIRLLVTAYRKKGLDGLRLKESPRNHSLLTTKQKDEVMDIITTKTPKDFGYETKYRGDFWDVDFLKQLVKDKYHVVYKTDDSYRRLFHHCGFTFHKPAKVNRKAEPHMKKRFEDRVKKNFGEEATISWYW